MSISFIRPAFQFTIQYVSVSNLQRDREYADSNLALYRLGTMLPEGQERHTVFTVVEGDVPISSYQHYAETSPVLQILNKSPTYQAR